MNHLIQQIIVSHVGVAGEAAATYIIPVPAKTRTLGYSHMTAGANGPLSDVLTVTNSIRFLGKDWLDQPILTIFTNVVSPFVTSGLITLRKGTHLKWVVRSDAAIANQFLLLIKFYDNL